MNGPARITALAVALTGLVISMSGCDKLAARSELNKGVEAYKSTHYEEAINHFQRATMLDPNLPMAKGYLATALGQNVVPGLLTPDNLKNAQQSIDIFQEVLAKDPHDVNSMKQVAGIEFEIKRLDEAKAWQKKILQEDPKDPEAAYTVGVIDWMQAHQNTLSALAPAGLNDDGEGNAKAPKKIMDPLKEKNTPLIDEALQYLNQALENRPTYDDAMSYMNLVYRAKANLDYGDAQAVKADVDTGEGLVLQGDGHPQGQRSQEEPGARRHHHGRQRRIEVDFSLYMHEDTASEFHGGRIFFE